ncbi:MAG: hypothetical protein DRJ32_00255 [Thermoprotei archaeon]|nr:MAG: hypothetical protein B6U94_01085 [Thermofilum sp. ex4484_79]RLE61746.1 MAG: hypothetical protein DRJ32_00255 [Thermoprotei archaeon]HDD63566.1 hypothetical protein [Thermoprotei archaeon]
MLAACFDIDGVLIDNTIRLKKCLEIVGVKAIEELSGESKSLFWKLFLSERFLSLDRPRPLGISYVYRAVNKGYKVVIVTGRPERLREATINQLNEFRISFDEIYFRRDNDFRKDFVVKPEIIRMLTYKYDFKEFHDDEEEILRRIAHFIKNAEFYHHKPNKVVLLNNLLQWSE